MNNLESYTLTYQYHQFEESFAIHADCFEWMGLIPKSSVHAIVTDPPYGVKEYDFDQLEKRQNGNGGVWRIPPSFDGHVRSPLPRFTALNGKERERLQRFFVEWGKLAFQVLRPGGHIFLASNAFLSQLVLSTWTELKHNFSPQRHKGHKDFLHVFFCVLCVFVVSKTSKIHSVHLLTFL